MGDEHRHDTIQWLRRTKIGLRAHGRDYQTVRVGFSSWNSMLYAYCIKNSTERSQTIEIPVVSTRSHVRMMAYDITRDHDALEKIVNATLNGGGLIAWMTPQGTKLDYTYIQESI